MTTAMSRTLGALFLVATFLMLIMSSCMSKEEKILDNIVNQKKAEIPYELLSDVKVIDIKYSTSDKLVTYTYTVEPGLIASTVKHAPELLKQGIAISISNSDDEKDFKTAIIDAQANIKCVVLCKEDTIADFNINYTDL